MQLVSDDRRQAGGEAEHIPNTRPCRHDAAGGCQAHPHHSPGRRFVRRRAGRRAVHLPGGNATVSGRAPVSRGRQHQQRARHGPMRACRDRVGLFSSPALLLCRDDALPACRCDAALLLARAHRRKVECPKQHRREHYVVPVLPSDAGCPHVRAVFHRPADQMGLFFTGALGAGGVLCHRRRAPCARAHEQPPPCGLRL